MKSITTFINEAADTPIKFIKSWSSNAPVKFDLWPYSFQRYDGNNLFLVANKESFTPSFKTWFEKNIDKFEGVLVYCDNSYKKFAVLSANKSTKDDGYALYCCGLDLDEIENWFKTKGKSTSTKALKYK